MTATRHAARYEVTRDPEGNFWTVSCACGKLQESTSSREQARHEYREHSRSAARREPAKSCQCGHRQDHHAGRTARGVCFTCYEASNHGQLPYCSHYKRPQ